MQTLDDLLESKPRVLWVGAHPDDESFAGAVLAKASLKCGCRLHFLVLTRGEGGEFPKNLQDGRDLGVVRSDELQEVVRLYRATLELEGWFNASLPVDSFPYRHELAARWAEDAGEDPALRVARTVREFRPDVVITFAPEFGATGHPEHQLASRFTSAGIRLAEDAGAALDAAPHRVPHTYYMLNRYRRLRLMGMKMDPREPTEAFDGRQECVDGRSCFQVMAANTLPHHTQNNDMRLMRLLSRFFHKVHLYKADPFTEIHDPYEEHKVRGMG
jgi:LmbE family N-acetylglucosaminyl deacetylase